MRLNILVKFFHSSIYLLPIHKFNNNIDPKIIFIANDHSHNYIYYNKIYNLNNQFVSSLDRNCHLHPFFSDQYSLWKQKNQIDNSMTTFCMEYNKIHKDVDLLFKQATTKSPIFIILDHYWLSPSLLHKYPHSDYLIFSDDINIHDSDFVMINFDQKNKDQI